MNYFCVQGALIAGIQAIPVQVECVQSRRLPYLQIIGGSGNAANELRERVIAALDSCRLRLPARRITVQFQPGVHGLPLEQLDLAVVIALLGSGGQIPPASIKGILVCASLGLDGSLRPSCNSAALRRLLLAGAYSSALLPWDGSEVLSEGQLQRGGGFRQLGQVVEFLCGISGKELQAAPTGAVFNEAIHSQVSGTRKPYRDPEAEPPPPDQAWNRLEGQCVAKRMLEVAAAGAHHVLLAGPSGARPDLLAHALSSLLPPLSEAESEEVGAIYALAGMEELRPSRPYFAFAGGKCLPPLLPDRRFAKVEEFLLAHRGVLFIDQVCERESTLFPDLLQPMLCGKMQIRVGTRRVEIPAEIIVVASSPFCGCGAKGDDRLHCTCRPTEARRYRERWRRLFRFPFDLCLSIKAERAKIPVMKTDGSHAERALLLANIQLARLRMFDRQGKWNSRLDENEVLEAKPWKERALKLWHFLEARDPGNRSQFVSLAKVAITLSDLRGGKELEELDLLEAHHYFSEGLAGGSGKRAASSSSPETNSIAIP